MRCMILVIPAIYAAGDPVPPPSAERIAEMDVFNTALIEAGVMETASGLQPPSAGAMVVFGADEVDILEVEPAGSVGGFWIINVGSFEEALEWAKRCPMEPGDILEIRPMEVYDDES